MAAPGPAVKIIMPVYEGVDMLDVCGPYEMFRWAGFQTDLVAEAPGTVRFHGGFRFDVRAGPGDATSCDALWVPGGDPSSLSRIIHDPKGTYLGFLARQAAVSRPLIDVTAVGHEHTRSCLPGELSRQIDRVPGRLRLGQVSTESQRAGRPSRGQQPGPGAADRCLAVTPPARNAARHCQEPTSSALGWCFASFSLTVTEVRAKLDSRTAQFCARLLGRRGSPALSRKIVMSASWS